MIQMLRPTMGTGTPAPGVQGAIDTAPLASVPVPSTRRCFDTVTLAKFLFL